MNKHKIRFSVIFCAALAIFILALLIWFFQRPPAVETKVNSHDQQTASESSQRTASASKFETNPIKKTILESNNLAAQHSNNIAPPGKIASVQNKIEASVNAMNNPIVFWGRVVDQDGNPLAGVKVLFDYRTWLVRPLDAAATQTKAERVSDSSGYFQFNGAIGDRLTIESVEKSGYMPSPKSRKTFAYASSPNLFSPDPNDPVIIRMWKRGPSEPLISRDEFYGFQPNGSVYVIDLLSAKNFKGKTEPGDLQIRINRPSNVKPREKYPWTIEISALSGGVVEATDDFLYQAPETGYSASLKIEMEPTSNEWTSVLKKSFYIKSREGKFYAAAQMVIRPKYNDASAIEMHWILNTNGSRNLQPN